MIMLTDMKKAGEIRKKAVGKYIDGKLVCNIEVRKDDIWFLCSEYDGYHVVAQWKHMTKEERKKIITQ